MADKKYLTKEGEWTREIGNAAKYHKKWMALDRAEESGKKYGDIIEHTDEYEEGKVYIITN